MVFSASPRVINQTEVNNLPLAPKPEISKFAKFLVASSSTQIDGKRTFTPLYIYPTVTYPKRNPQLAIPPRENLPDDNYIHYGHLPGHKISERLLERCAVGIAFSCVPLYI